MVRRCLVNFQGRGVLLIWTIVGQGPIALVVGAGGGCFDIFSLIYHSSFLSPSLWETARYRLKYCLKGPLSPKQPTNNQPTQFENLNTFSILAQFLLIIIVFSVLNVLRVQSSPLKFRAQYPLYFCEKNVYLYIFFA